MAQHLLTDNEIVAEVDNWKASTDAEQRFKINGEPVTFGDVMRLGKHGIYFGETKQKVEVRHRVRTKDTNLYKPLQYSAADRYTYHITATSYYSQSVSSDSTIEDYK